MQLGQTFVAPFALCDTLRIQLLKQVQSEAASDNDYRDPRGTIGQIYKGRRRECAGLLYRAMGTPGATASFRDFKFFGPPYPAFLCMDKGFGLTSAWVLGIYAQTLTLAMAVNGLASCAQGAVGRYPDLVRAAFGLGSEAKVLFGASFGCKGTSMQGDEAVTGRVSLTDTATFKGQSLHSQAESVALAGKTRGPSNCT